MTRTLLAIAGLGLIVCIACFAGAAAVSGHMSWSHTWRVRNGSFIVGHNFTPDSQSETREIAWSGGDSLDVDVDADVSFTQSPGPAKLVISGSKAAVDAIRLSGSRLESDDDGGRVKVTLTAPDVRRFSLSGDGSIAIAKYDQDSLDLDLSGSGHIDAAGKARSVKLDISGDGDADLGQLAAQDAKVSIEGSGRTTLAPTQSADLDISGDGRIELLTHPANVRSDVSGSGRIVQGAPAAADSSRPTPARP
ncbi:MAG TPA: DUF2807 domain-containing protein [Caulobacteraceae bacterium]|nr:DUF2807 domain-containing protein [Caulobacteraceae bacterium]